jgi:hypothetical protein
MLTGILKDNVHTLISSEDHAYFYAFSAINTKNHVDLTIRLVRIKQRMTELLLFSHTAHGPGWPALTLYGKPQRGPLSMKNMAEIEESLWPGSSPNIC